MEKVLNWIRIHVTLKDLTYWFVIGLLMIGLSLSARSCRNLSDKYDNNLHALIDTIAYYQSENGALIASKTAFESNIKELKLANSELYQEINDMKVKMKNVNNASHIEGNIDFGKQDTVYIVKTDTIGNFTQKFDFSNQWRILNGQIAFNNPSLGLSIENDKILFDYTIVIDKDNKLYVKSNNPYVTYNELSGFTIPKEKRKHFSIGPTIGVGYGVINRKPDLFIGISASWKMFEF